MNVEITDTVVLKCETQKNFSEIKKKSDIWELMLSIATTFSYKDNQYKIWTFNQKNDLIKYLQNKNVVGFNCVRFDLPLLYGKHFNDPTYIITNDHDDKIFHVSTDIFCKIMEKVYNVDRYDFLLEKMYKHPLTNMQVYSLYNIYCNTLNRKISKSLYDIKSVDLFKSKKVLELVEYNIFKLRMIKEIYEWVCRNKYILNGDYDVVKVDDVYSPKDVDIDKFIPF